MDIDISTLVDELHNIYSSDTYLNAKAIIDETLELKRRIIEYCRLNNIERVVTPNGNMYISDYVSHRNLHTELMREILTHIGR